LKGTAGRELGEKLLNFYAPILTVVREDRQS
jgi:hypothetical protein